MTDPVTMVLDARRPEQIFGDIEGLALTHCDFGVPSRPTDEWASGDPVKIFESKLDTPVLIESHGPAYTDKRDRIEELIRV